MKEQTVKIYKKTGRWLLDIIKWIVMGFLTGILVGAVGTAFSYLLSKAAAFMDGLSASGWRTYDCGIV